MGISSLQELCVKTTNGEVEEGVKRHLRSGAASVAAHKFALWSSEKSRKRTRTETQVQAEHVMSVYILCLSVRAVDISERQYGLRSMISCISCVGQELCANRLNIEIED